MIRSEGVVLDTSIWITAFRGDDESILDRARDLIAADRVVICGPIQFELGRGIKRAERERVLPLLAAVRTTRFDEADWAAAGALDSSLRAKGLTIPPMDILISRVCIREALPLWTLDRHFEKVPGLVLFDGD